MSRANAVPSNRSPRPATVLLAALVAAGLFQGCATTRHTAVPAESAARAEVPGYAGAIRYYPRDAVHLKLFERDFLESLEREAAGLRARGADGPLPPAAYLAISGGGDNGAFGAGFLCGWTRAGTRPEFKLVTGISTGALIAPFAFLGPEYDGKLRELYTTISDRDILSRRSLLSALFKDALADNGPLQDLVRTHISPDLIARIAEEHAKGRILLVGTTDLDASRPVIWNLTKIAASGHPGALELVRKLLIASAAIPGEFPPVMIDVTAAGRSYQEMHVDGGAAAQVFLYPPGMRLGELSQAHAFERRRTLYVIRNARLDPQWSEVERRTLPIIRRAIGSLIQYQGIGDLYRMYAITQRDGEDFNLAFIPETFRTPHTGDFETAYMRELFDLGSRLAEAGYAWHKEPPVQFNR